MNDLFQNTDDIKGKDIEIKRITRDDAGSLRELVGSERVYRYEPTFLFERKYTDVYEVIDRLYSECIEGSLILGIYRNGDFCGIMELYGLNDRIHKVSVGYRILERYWGQGIATSALALMTDYLYNETDIEIITASTLPENTASERVLEKNGFSLVVKGAAEDWGYESFLPTDKWIR